jgi:hypothetical protein
MSGWAVRGTILGAVVAVAVALWPAPPAGASHPGGLPNWPALLPPRSGDPDRLELNFDVCPSRGSDEQLSVRVGVSLGDATAEAGLPRSWARTRCAAASRRCAQARPPA